MTEPRPVTRKSLRGPSIAEVDALNEAASEYAEAAEAARRAIAARSSAAAALRRAAERAYGRSFPVAAAQKAA